MARILVVEDDVHILRIITIWLKRNGHEVTEANDGQQARDLLADQSVEGFDVVVSDINMPGMSGIELVRWLRHERKSDVPIILLSSRCDQSVISKELGPLDVQVHPKPFSPSRLIAEIERRLTKAGTAHPASRDDATELEPGSGRGPESKSGIPAY